MAQFFYNFSYPLNGKDVFRASDILDYQIQMRPGRSYIANSFRINGILQVQKIKLDGTIAPITKQDQVFIDPYCGVHSFFRTTNVLINGSSVETNAQYHRYSGMKKQSLFTLEGLNTSSDALVELCGSQNNIMLLGTPNTFSAGQSGVSFSAKPYTAINGSSSNLPQSLFPSIRMTINLASNNECLYTTHTPTDAYMTNPDTGFTELIYSLTQMQSTWYETIETKVPTPITFETVSLVNPSLLTNNATFALTAAGLYQALSISFRQQANSNKLTANNLLCEFIPGVEPASSKGQLYITVDGNGAVITYPIQSYADIARNYAKSLGASVKNSLMNAYLSKTCTFGIGFQFAVSSSDRLAVNLILDPNQYNPSISPCDVFMYLQGFIQV